MLFNSIEFIAVFLPLAVAGFFLLAAWRANCLPMAWLVLASLVFYSWWDYRNLFVIVPTIVGNYLIGWAIGVARAAGHTGRARFLAAGGLAANLAAIGYFKYFNFAATALAGATGLDIATRAILLPLGISFFTFQEIKFLVDRYAGVAPQPDPLGYASSSVFFRTSSPVRSSTTTICCRNFASRASCALHPTSSPTAWRFFPRSIAGASHQRRRDRAL